MIDIVFHTEDGETSRRWSYVPRTNDWVDFGEERTYTVDRVLWKDLTVSTGYATHQECIVHAYCSRLSDE